MSGRVFVVTPPQALVERPRLFDAVAHLYDARFVPEARGTQAVARIRFGGGAVGTDRLPTLELTEADPAPARIILTHAPCVPRPFRGRVLGDSQAAPLPSDIAERCTSVLANDDGSRPVWASAEARLEVAAPAPRELDLQETLRSRFSPGRFIDLLPLLSFVSRHAQSYAPPVQTAAFVLDDPNLHAMRYGFVHFDQLAREAQRDGYHVAFATIPLDLWWANRKAVRLFRERSDRLSLLMHGNDHTFCELDHKQTEPQRTAMLAQALGRVDRFERRYQIPVARVMAPPHGACSRESAETMFRLGFDALCISRTHPWARDGLENDVLAGSRPVHLVGSEFPLLLRHHLQRDRDDLIFRAFLGQPLVVYGHQSDLADGPAILRETASFIANLGPVDWLSLDRIARSRFSTRGVGSCLVVRPQTRRVDVQLDGVYDQVSVELPPSGPTGTITVVSNGRSFTGPGPHPVTGDLSIAVRQGPGVEPRVVARNSTSAWPLIRRALTETRDRLAPIRP